ncbi:hypothetical protein EMIT0P291_140149 [Pseudomonas sp. IT-P291]
MDYLLDLLFLIYGEGGAELSAMDGAARTAGDQRRAAGCLHAIQSHGNAVDGVGAAAFGNREGPLAQGAHHHVAFSCHGFAVEVGVGDGFSDNATVVCGVAEADYAFHQDLQSSKNFGRGK